MRMRAIPLLLCLTGVLPWAAAQAPASRPAAAPMPHQTYAITFTIEQHVPPGTLLNGKPVRGTILNSRSFRMSLISGKISTANVKVGNRVPVVTGGSMPTASSSVVNAQFQYQSIGIDINCRLYPHDLIDYDASVTSLAPTELTSPVRGFHEPTIRTIYTNGIVQIKFDRRTLLSTVADLSSKTIYYFWMTVTKE